MHRLKDIIKYTGLTQRDFAQKIGISGNALTELFKGRSKGLSEQTLAALASVFHVNINWLLTGEGQMFEPEESTVAEEQAEYKTNGDDSLKNLSRNYWFKNLPANKQEIIKAVISIEDEKFLDNLKGHVAFKLEDEE